MKNTILQIYNTKQKEPKENIKDITLPFVQGTSESIQRLMKKHQITRAHKPSNDSKIFLKTTTQH